MSGRRVTTFAGGGWQPKLQVDGGEAIGGDREHGRAREGEGPGGIPEGRTGKPG